MSIFFSVFTPIYNRKHTIERVWKSLCSQTYQNFEWIIVDDGSSDEPINLLRYYEYHATFSIVIIQFSKNRGKHVAWNEAVKKARGQLFVPADSDDAFVPETLQFFAEKWDSFSDKDKFFLSGINVLCKDAKKGTIIGTKFPMDGIISNNAELYFKYRITGEKWGCIRTDLLRKRIFPEIRGHYFTESWVWFWLSAKGFRVPCFNKALRIYYSDQENSIMISASRIKKTSLSEYLLKLWMYAEEFNYFFPLKGPINTAKDFIFLWMYNFLYNIHPLQFIRKFKSHKSKLLLILTFIPGYFAFRIKKSSYKVLYSDTVTEFI